MSLPLSDSNQTILWRYGEKTLRHHLSCQAGSGINLECRVDGSQTWKGRLWKWLNPWKIGKNLGWAFGMTHSQQISNTLIAFLVYRILRETPTTVEQNKGWFDSLFTKESVQTSIVEASKLSFTPIVQPFIITTFRFIGGMSLWLICSGITGCFYSLYKRRKVQPLTLYHVDKMKKLLEKATFENKRYRLDEITFETRRSFKNTAAHIYRYTLCSELMQTKVEKIPSVLQKHAECIAGGNFESKNLKRAIADLTTDGNTEEQAIIATIEWFARHYAKERAEELCPKKAKEQELTEQS